MFSGVKSSGAGQQNYTAAIHNFFDQTITKDGCVNTSSVKDLFGDKEIYFEQDEAPPTGMAMSWLTSPRYFLLNGVAKLY